MKCPKCNKEIVDNAKFCSKCGVNIAEALEEKAKLEELKKKEEKVAEKKEPKKENQSESKKIESKVEEDKNITTKDELKKESKSEFKKVEPKEKEEKKSTQKSKPKKENKSEFKKVEPQIKEKKKKKNHTRFKVFLILIILLVIVFFASYGLDKIGVLPDSIAKKIKPAFEIVDGWFGIEESNDTVSDKKDEKSIILKEKDKELVYDYYNKNIFDHTYKIPAINLAYDNVEKINKEIKDSVEKEIKELEGKDAFQEGLISKVDYKWYTNKNILSLVYVVNKNKISQYYVYNIDVYTGKKIENKEILEAEKLDEDEFSEKCSTAVKKYFEKNFKGDSLMRSNFGTFYDRALEESMGKSKFKVSNTKIFLDDEGDINLIAELNLFGSTSVSVFIVDIEDSTKDANKIFEDNTVSTQSSNEIIENSTSNTTNSTNEKKTTDTTNNMIDNTMMKNVTKPVIVDNQIKQQ